MHLVETDWLGQDFNRSLTPEHKLLLTCSRQTLTSPQLEKVSDLLARDLDWELLIAFGKRHGLLPLFYSQLRKFDSNSVPAPYIDTLKSHFQVNLARNVLLTNELISLLQLFSAAGIEAIPYKGPALALFAYGDLNLRRFTDLDILVRKRDVSPASQLLIDAGYAADWTAAQKDLLLRTQHNLQFTKLKQRLIVELHWEVASELFAQSVQAEDFWDRLVPLNINGTPVKSLGAEDLLLSLCIHGSKHLWERLSWICDIAELLKSHSDINWEELFRRARISRSEPMVGIGLLLAHRLFDSSLPARIRRRVEEDPMVVSLFEDTCQRIFTRGDAELISTDENVRFNWALRKGWRDRLRYLRLLLRPTDADVRVATLPRLLCFVYYIVRPIRLLTQRRVH